VTSHSDAAPSADSDYRPDRATSYDLKIALAAWEDDDALVHVRHPSLASPVCVCGVSTVRYEPRGRKRYMGAPDGPVTCSPCNHWLMRQSLVFAELCGLVDVGPTPANLWVGR
jgi:hypothetical protein